ncbi:ExbD/TolR family protein [Marinobacter mobilis]|uniref:Biopolymer transport protein ExbD n=1 Tax=Marinobacter mobilis TaxID=488533 RepID=A0A1H2UZL4_9GAMM|nr:biopolymer transporter ExbD [Marinobacter mobilis]SDW61480.1 Biopolymer transport protein ExbD [Marinobacter mobilis]
MKSSRRAKRMQRHYRRMHRPGGLNLVSLMDIFTILVFFLMVNSSDVKVLRTNSDVPLPSSSAEHQARDTLTVVVTGQAILVNGREVARLPVTDVDTATIKGLAEELSYLRDRHQSIPQAGLEVTILAGKDTEYRLLRRIMQTCVDQEFRQVRLAVESQQRDVDHG